MNFADQRILAGVPATLVGQFTDQHGQPAAAPAATVAVTRADGSVLLAAGTATVAVADGSSGARTVLLTVAQTAQLDYLTAVWTDPTAGTTTTTVAVVGGYMFDFAELKRLDGMTNMSLASLALARQSVEELVEERTGWCWAPRLVVETVDVRQFVSGDVGYVHAEHRPVRALKAITVDGVVQTLSDWALDREGFLRRTSTGAAAEFYTASTVTMIYEVGEDRPPVSLARALIDAARTAELDSKSGVSSRALSTTNEFGNINYARATAVNLFGNPHVDAILSFWDRRRVVIV
jgi:hypothetical protein